MHPIMFKIGPVNVYSYGVMVALGFALATICIYTRAPGFGIDKNNVVDLMILMLVSGIIGARALYVAQNFNYYLANPIEILNLSKGGLVWYGAFIAGLGASAIYIKIKSMDFWSSVDLAAPYIAMAQAFGRIGCYLNGCCYGIESHSPIAWFAQSFAGDAALRYPTQLYSAASLLLIYVLLRIWQDHRRFRGEIFLGYCILYSLKRFMMEFIRGDNPRIFFNLTMSQVISCLVFASSAVMIVYMAGVWKKRL